MSPDQRSELADLGGPQTSHVWPCGTFEGPAPVLPAVRRASQSGELGPLCWGTALPSIKTCKLCDTAGLAVCPGRGGGLRGRGRVARARPRPLASAVFDDAVLRRHRPEFGESSSSVEQMLATAWARTCTQRT